MVWPQHSCCRRAVTSRLARPSTRDTVGLVGYRTKVEESRLSVRLLYRETRSFPPRLSPGRPPRGVGVGSDRSWEVSGCTNLRAGSPKTGSPVTLTFGITENEGTTWKRPTFVKRPLWQVYLYSPRYSSVGVQTPVGPTTVCSQFVIQTSRERINSVDVNFDHQETVPTVKVFRCPRRSCRHLWDRKHLQIRLRRSREVDQVDYRALRGTLIIRVGYKCPRVSSSWVLPEEGVTQETDEYITTPRLYVQPFLHTKRGLPLFIFRPQVEVPLLVVSLGRVSGWSGVYECTMRCLSWNQLKRLSFVVPCLIIGYKDTCKDADFPGKFISEEGSNETRL